MSKQVKIFFAIVVAALVGWFIYDALSLPGVNDLPGDFEETAFYRNENNTGPIVRIYAVTVGNPGKADMEAYGNFMPHTKYGTTKVYFFLKGKPAPDTVFPGNENVAPEFRPYLLATYEKDSMGKVSFRKL